MRHCDCLLLSLFVEIVANVAKVEIRYTEWPAYTSPQILLKNLSKSSNLIII